VPADPTKREGGEGGVDPTLCHRNYPRRVRVLTRQPLKEKESREIHHGLLKCFLLLQTVYPAVCNMGVEESVADRANALSEAEQKQGRKRKHHERRQNPSTQSEEGPKG